MRNEPVVEPVIHAAPCGEGTMTAPVIQAAGGGNPNGFCGSPTCFGITAILLGIAGLMCSIIPGIRVHKCVTDLYDDDDNFNGFDEDDDDCTLLFPLIVVTFGFGLLISSCVVCCCWCGACGAAGRNNAAATVVLTPRVH